MLRNAFKSEGNKWPDHKEVEGLSPFSSDGNNSSCSPPVTPQRISSRTSMSPAAGSHRSAAVSPRGELSSWSPVSARPGSPKSPGGDSLPMFTPEEMEAAKEQMSALDNAMAVQRISRELNAFHRRRQESMSMQATAKLALQNRAATTNHLRVLSQTWQKPEPDKTDPAVIHRQNSMHAASKSLWESRASSSLSRDRSVLAELRTALLTQEIEEHKKLDAAGFVDGGRRMSNSGQINTDDTDANALKSPKSARSLLDDIIKRAGVSVPAPDTAPVTPERSSETLHPSVTLSENDNTHVDVDIESVNDINAHVKHMWAFGEYTTTCDAGADGAVPKRPTSWGLKDQGIGGLSQGLFRWYRRLVFIDSVEGVLYVGVTASSMKPVAHLGGATLKETVSISAEGGDESSVSIHMYGREITSIQLAAALLPHPSENSGNIPQALPLPPPPTASSVLSPEKKTEKPPAPPRRGSRTNSTLIGSSAQNVLGSGEEGEFLEVLRLAVLCKPLTNTSSSTSILPPKSRTSSRNNSTVVAIPAM